MTGNLIRSPQVLVVYESILRTLDQLFHLNHQLSTVIGVFSTSRRATYNLPWRNKFVDGYLQAVGEGQSVQNGGHLVQESVQLVQLPGKILPFQSPLMTDLIPGMAGIGG